MTAKTWVILLAAGAVLVSRESCRAQAEGKLRGEIKARGESIKQLGELAAKKRTVYLKAKAAYVKTPTLESCSVVLLSCEDRHATDSTRIALLEKQSADWKKLNNKGRIFGILPRPVVGVGVSWCPTKQPACVFAGFPILK